MFALHLISGSDVGAPIQYRDSSVAHPRFHQETLSIQGAADEDGSSSLRLTVSRILSAFFVYEMVQVVRAIM